jgi:release factor glutamine methyltransferase
MTTNKPYTIGTLLQFAVTALMGHSGSPRLDAHLLLGRILGVPRETLIAHPERPVTDTDAHTYHKLITLRQRGMPVAYLLGSRPFYHRTFRVSPQVLIPRPETEKLVDYALRWATGRGELRIIDIGTGSGVIGVTLADQLGESRVIATDISSAALALATENGRDLPNLAFATMDLLGAFPARPIFDIVASNLPYIASAELNILEVAKFEPLVALDGGNDGLDLIRALLQQLPTRLRTPGLVLLEHGADQGAAVAALAQQTFPDQAVKIVKDDAGLDRFVVVESLSP